MQQIGLRDPHEPVRNAACILKSSRSDASRVEGLAERECGARRVERGDGAVGSTQESVTPNCITVEPGDRPCRVDGEGGGPRDGARRIERDEGAVGTLQIGARPVSGGTRDRPSRIDTTGGDARICIDHGEGAVGSPQEALETCATKVSHDYSRWVDGEGLGLKRAREIDGREGAVGSPQEAVLHATCVKIDSRDGPGRVDAGRWTKKSINRASYETARWCIERGDASVASAKETVIPATCVAVPPDDHPARSEASGGRECGTRHIDRGEAAARRPEEAVRHATCVDVRSDDHSGRGDGTGRGECGARRVERGDGGVRVTQGRVAEIRTLSIMPAVSIRANAKSTPTLMKYVSENFCFHKMSLVCLSFHRGTAGNPARYNAESLDFFWEDRGLRAFAKTATAWQARMSLIGICRGRRVDLLAL